jgi:hypothetical protein
MYARNYGEQMPPLAFFSLKVACQSKYNIRRELFILPLKKPLLQSVEIQHKTLIFLQQSDILVNCTSVCGHWCN